MTSRLFDHYVAVDWSARSSPSPAAETEDAIWIGEASAFEGMSPPRYRRTRAAAEEDLRARLRDLVEGGRRVLIGFDFPYGYPAGFADSLDLRSSAPPWRRVFDLLKDEISDGPDNSNNRFEVARELNRRCSGAAELGPFWGGVQGRAESCPPLKRPGAYDSRAGVFRGRCILRELRHSDAWSRRRRAGQSGVAQPIWKVAYTGSVGSQALLGIPVLARLRDDEVLAPHSAIWPLETGFTSRPTPRTGAAVVHAEIFPSLLAPMPPDRIRDRAQVRTVARWLADLDGRGLLAGLFAAPPDVDAEQLADCVSEEGWTLGVGHPDLTVVSQGLEPSVTELPSPPTDRSFVFVTANENKVAEAETALGRPVESIDLELPEIQSLDLAEVVGAKADGAWRRLRRPVVVEDTALCLGALSGFPGPLVKWLLKSVGVEGIARLGDALGDDRAVAACALVYKFGPGPEDRVTATVEVPGRLAHPPRGLGGFGWDPAFQPDGHDRTLGEMSDEEKDRVGARGQVWRKLADLLARPTEGS